MLCEQYTPNCQHIAADGALLLSAVHGRSWPALKDFPRIRDMWEKGIVSEFFKKHPAFMPPYVTITKRLLRTALSVCQNVLKKMRWLLLGEVFRTRAGQTHCCTPCATHCIL